MATMEKITYSGKIKHNPANPTQLIEVQRVLLESGFKFYTGKQEPRNCFGVMWRNHEIRSAANEHAFKAYGVPLVDDIVQVNAVAVKPEKAPYTREQKAAQARKAGLKHKEMRQDRVIRLIKVVRTALVNIGEYAPNLYGTNSRSLARKKAWQVLILECKKLSDEPIVVNSLHAAIRAVLEGNGKSFMISDSRTTASILKGK